MKLAFHRLHPKSVSASKALHIPSSLLLLPSFPCFPVCLCSLRLCVQALQGRPALTTRFPQAAGAQIPPDVGLLPMGRPPGWQGAALRARSWPRLLQKQTAAVCRRLEVTRVCHGSCRSQTTPAVNNEVGIHPPLLLLLLDPGGSVS